MMKDSWKTLRGSQEPPQGDERAAKKHLAIGLCVLALAIGAWTFRAEVRGLAAWAVARIQGQDVSLAAKAPGLGNVFRFGKEYTMEEFLVACTEGTHTSVAKIFDKHPYLLEPKNGTTIVHLVAARPVNPEVFGLILERVGKEAVNARDSQGRTPLHIAAVSAVPAGFVLALRAKGANIIVHDNDGKTPVDAFFESPLSRPTKISRQEAELFRLYGHTRNIPYSSDRYGNPRTSFTPLADQVPEMEGKRYFTQLAEAQAVTRDAWLGTGPVPSGDTVGPRRQEMPSHEIQRAKMRGTYREPAEPLWKGLRVLPDTGTALARLKCLLPMAYPSSLNFFSARMAGDIQEPLYITEWNAWDVPAEARAGIMMEYLRQRMQQARPKSGSPSGTFVFGGRSDYAYHATRVMRERGDAPSARNPLVMTWMLLEYAPPMKAAERPALLLHTDVTPLKEGSAPEDPYAGKELANLRALHDVLPKTVWRQVGMHLVAAAYTADKRRDIQWGAGFMPGHYKKNGGLNALRLWACEERKDSSEPLRHVLAATGNVSPEQAKALVALVLRSGPQSTARDENGKTPVEYARDMGVSPAIIALLEKAPVYEPPVERPEKAAAKQP